MTHWDTKTFTICGAAVVFACCLWADTKGEIDLKARLAAAETARATLTLELAKLNAANATRAAGVLASSTTAAGAQVNASNLASAHADVAQSLAEANGIMAQKAASDAAAAANAVAVAVATANATARAQNIALMITQAFGFLVVLVGVVSSTMYKALVDRRDRDDAKELARTLEIAIERREVASLAHRGVVIQKLDSVGDKADLAYKEANTVNQKLAEIGVQMRDGRPLVDKG